MRKALLTTMMSVMIFCSVLLFGVTAFASSGKAKLSTKKKSIELGNSFTLKLKNNKKKVKWSVTKGKNCVLLSKKGKTSVKIVGIKTGSAKVQAKVGKKKYLCTVKIKKPTAPDISLNGSSIDWKGNTTIWVYNISPYKKTYVPESLTRFNVWRMNEGGSPIEKLSSYAVPINLASVYADPPRVVDGISFRKMNNGSVVYLANDRINVATDDDGNTDSYYDFQIIKNNVLFTYRFDSKEGEFVYKGAKYVG